MAVTTTPLGFQKPDGNESIRNGDNVISANAQKAQDLIAAAQSATSALTGRVGTAEASLTSHSGRLDAAEANIRAGIGSGGGSASNVGLDTDGVPYYEIGASDTTIAADTDGVPYFL